MDVRPVGPACGTEVNGLDARRATDAEVAVVADALATTGVVVLRGQDLDDEDQRSFAARFGDPFRFPFGTPVHEALPEVHAIATDGSGPKVTNVDIWHSDATFMAEPPMATMLRAVSLPAAGGDTLFANMYGAYSMVSPSLRAVIDGLSATHDYAQSTTHRSRLHDDYPPVSHPVAGPA